MIRANVAFTYVLLIAFAINFNFARAKVQEGGNDVKGAAAGELDQDGKSSDGVPVPEAQGGGLDYSGNSKVKDHEDDAHSEGDSPKPDNQGNAPETNEEGSDRKSAEEKSKKDDGETEQREIAKVEQAKRKAKVALVLTVNQMIDRRNEILTETRNLQKVFTEFTHEKEMALLRKQASGDDKNLISEKLQQSDIRLKKYKIAIPYINRAASELKNEAEVRVMEMKDLHSELEDLKEQKAFLISQFEKIGLGHYVNAVLSKKVNPFAKDALLEGSRYVALPVAAGIAKAARLENKLEQQINSRIRVQSPFYAGLLTAFVCLVPLVIECSALLKLRRSFLQLTMRHHALSGCAYFTLLNFCLMSAKVISIDVLENLQHHGQALYDFAVLVNGILYFFFWTAHALTSIDGGNNQSWSLSVAIGLIYVHWVYHASAHLRRGERLDVHLLSCLFYTATFIWAARHLVQDAMRLRNAKQRIPTKQPVTLGRGGSTLRVPRSRLGINRFASSPR